MGETISTSSSAKLTVPRAVGSYAAKARHLHCPACDILVAHRHKFAKGGSDILECLSCGLGRAETGDFDPASYYTSDYFDGGHSDGYSDYLGAELVLRREFAKTVQFLRRYRSAGRLLEIGCAYGFFLNEAQAYFETYGIELAADAVDHCRRTGLNVTQGIADAQAVAGFGPQDAIVLLDVIEHVPDPQEIFRSCSECLKPGGVMLITTGDFGSLAAKLAGRHWRLMTPPQHLWYFTAESMKRLSAKAGLKLEAIDHPWKLVPVSLIAFQVRRMLGLRGAPMRGGGAFGLPINLFDAMRLVLRKP